MMGGRGAGSPASRQSPAAAVATPASPVASALATDVNSKISGERTYEASFTYQGVTYTDTRTTKRDYTHASLVAWRDQGIPYIASFHGSEAAAAKGVMTGMQRRNGLHVVGVVPLHVIKKPKK